MADSSLSLIAVLKTFWLPIVLVFIVLWLLSNKYQKHLSSIPGPAAAGYTKLWRLYRVYRGRFTWEQIKLHRELGPVVRIAPRIVSIGDPKAIPIIYPLKQSFTKTAFYPIQSVSWKKQTETNIFSTRDPAKHRKDKQRISSAYSMSNLLQSEEKVDVCTQLFKDRLDEWAKSRKSIDFGAWLQYYAFDVVGEFTFASRLGFLEQGKDVDGMMEAIEGMLSYATLCGQLPEAHPFLLGNPLLTKFAPAMETWNQTLVFTLKAMQSRTKIKRDEELEDVENQGVDMLSRWNSVKTSDPLKMGTKDIVVALSTNVFAGSDTTAIALRSVIYNLCRNPDKLEKMLAELDAADKEQKLSNPVSFKEAQTHLPYFGAVLKEAMRLHPSVGLMMERHVPPEGVELCGHYIPSGTIVGINPWVLNYDPAIFERPESFEPERWLVTDDDAGLRSREDILMFNFGAGARACIGKNISLMEMHKVLPELYRRYNIEWTHPEKDWKTRGYWFVQQEELICNLSLR